MNRVAAWNALSTEQKKSYGWWSIVGVGRDPQPASGPFRTLAQATKAIERFRSRYGWQAGTYLAAGCSRIVGPFRTRSLAKTADISDYSHYYNL